MATKKHSHPRGGHTDVQSIRLPKKLFPMKFQAQAWLHEHGFKTGIDEMRNFWAARQRDPHPGARMRTIYFGAGGIEAVIEAHGPKPK